ncbi:fatty-acid--CoA ligase [Gordonia neofelifaecis NRRL B-59395]|uniref:Fatty-acid--CoA ligase n=1 Tax=Gordonia neofelifaecis NRRL B-59395 TaxID=644548 RepID=F1YH73_9ACTN|nr:AMP-binding protein [Gordonia neofelifaecis]EGD55988.1 fatty-acid--CoA ligase [Gordonia neofelifaecis NRRL B-59395]
MTTTATYFPWDNASRGAAPCIRDDDAAYTYAEFAARVEACAEQLSGHGVRDGDVVATFLPNRSELILVMAAAWRIGAAATPVNPAFTVDEAAYQLDDAGVRVIVSDRPIGDRDVIDVADLATAPTQAWQPPATPAPESVALLIYTSGSTGRPKGVQLTHANLRYMATTMAGLQELTPADHALVILPLFHVNAICVTVLTPFIAGAQVSIVPKFSVGGFFADVERLRPTYFSGVPTIYALLVSSPQAAAADLSSLRFGICGAAPISRELLTLIGDRFSFPIFRPLRRFRCTAI